MNDKKKGNVGIYFDYDSDKLINLIINKLEAGESGEQDITIEGKVEIDTEDAKKNLEELGETAKEASEKIDEVGKSLEDIGEKAKEVDEANSSLEDSAKIVDKFNNKQKFSRMKTWFAPIEQVGEALNTVIGKIDKLSSADVDKKTQTQLYSLGASYQALGGDLANVSAEFAKFWDELNANKKSMGVTFSSIDELKQAFSEIDSLVDASQIKGLGDQITRIINPELKKAKERVSKTLTEQVDELLGVNFEDLGSEQLGGFKDRIKTVLNRLRDELKKEFAKSTSAENVVDIETFGMGEMSVDDIKMLGKQYADEFATSFQDYIEKNGVRFKIKLYSEDYESSELLDIKKFLDVLNARLREIGYDQYTINTNELFEIDKETSEEATEGIEQESEAVAKLNEQIEKLVALRKMLNEKTEEAKKDVDPLTNVDFNKAREKYLKALTKGTGKDELAGKAKEDAEAYIKAFKEAFENKDVGKIFNFLFDKSISKEEFTARKGMLKVVTGMNTGKTEDIQAAIRSIDKEGYDAFKARYDNQQDFDAQFKAKFRKGHYQDDVGKIQKQVRELITTEVGSIAEAFDKLNKQVEDELGKIYHTESKKWLTQKEIDKIEHDKALEEAKKKPGKGQTSEEGTSEGGEASPSGNRTGEGQGQEATRQEINAGETLTRAGETTEQAAETIGESAKKLGEAADRLEKAAEKEEEEKEDKPTPSTGQTSGERAKVTVHTQETVKTHRKPNGDTTTTKNTNGQATTQTPVQPKEKKTNGTDQSANPSPTPTPVNPVNPVDATGVTVANEQLKELLENLRKLKEENKDLSLINTATLKVGNNISQANGIPTIVDMQEYKDILENITSVPIEETLNNLNTLIERVKVMEEKGKELNSEALRILKLTSGLRKDASDSGLEANEINLVILKERYEEVGKAIDALKEKFQSMGEIDQTHLDMYTSKLEILENSLKASRDLIQARENALQVSTPVDTEALGRSTKEKYQKIWDITDNMVNEDDEIQLEKSKDLLLELLDIIKSFNNVEFNMMGIYDDEFIENVRNTMNEAKNFVETETSSFDTKGLPVKLYNTINDILDVFFDDVVQSNIQSLSDTIQSEVASTTSTPQTPQATTAQNEPQERQEATTATQQQTDASEKAEEQAKEETVSRKELIDTIINQRLELEALRKQEESISKARKNSETEVFPSGVQGPKKSDGTYDTDWLYEQAKSKFEASSTNPREYDKAAYYYGKYYDAAQAQGVTDIKQLGKKDADIDDTKELLERYQVLKALDEDIAKLQQEMINNRAKLAQMPVTSDTFDYSDDPKEKLAQMGKNIDTMRTEYEKLNTQIEEFDKKVNGINRAIKGAKDGYNPNNLFVQAQNAQARGDTQAATVYYGKYAEIQRKDGQKPKELLDKNGFNIGKEYEDEYNFLAQVSQRAAELYGNIKTLSHEIQELKKDLASTGSTGKKAMNQVGETTKETQNAVKRALEVIKNSGYQGINKDLFREISNMKMDTEADVQGRIDRLNAMPGADQPGKIKSTIEALTKLLEIMAQLKEARKEDAQATQDQTNQQEQLNRATSGSTGTSTGARTGGNNNRTSGTTGGTGSQVGTKPAVNNASKIAVKVQNKRRNWISDALAVENPTQQYVDDMSKALHTMLLYLDEIGKKTPEEEQKIRDFIDALKVKPNELNLDELRKELLDTYGTIEKAYEALQKPKNGVTTTPRKPAQPRQQPQIRQQQQQQQQQPIPSPAQGTPSGGGATPTTTPTTGTQTPVTTAPQVDVSAEMTALGQLESKLKTDIPNAVGTKNKAFVDEGKLVGQVIGKEIAALKHLEEELSKGVPEAVQAKNGAMTAQGDQDAVQGELAQTEEATVEVGTVTEQTAEKVESSNRKVKHSIEELREMYNGFLDMLRNGDVEGFTSGLNDLLLDDLRKIAKFDEVDMTYKEYKPLSRKDLVGAITERTQQSLNIGVEVEPQVATPDVNTEKIDAASQKYKELRENIEAVRTEIGGLKDSFSELVSRVDLKEETDLFGSLITVLKEKIPEAIEVKDKAFEKEKGVVEGVVKEEKESLMSLIDVLYNQIPEAIEHKNAAFENETEVVRGEVNAEIEALSELEELLSKIVKSLNFKNIGAKDVNALTSAIDGLNKLFSSSNIATFVQNVQKLYTELDNFSKISVDGDNNIFGSLKEILSHGEELKNFANIVKETETKINEAAKKAKADAESNKQVEPPFGVELERFTPDSAGWDDFLKKLHDVHLELGDIQSVYRSLRKDEKGNLLESFKVTTKEGISGTIGANTEGFIARKENSASDLEKSVLKLERLLANLNKVKTYEGLENLKKEIESVSQTLDEAVKKSKLGANIRDDIKQRTVEGLSNAEGRVSSIEADKESQKRAKEQERENARLAKLEEKRHNETQYDEEIKKIQELGKAKSDYNNIIAEGINAEDSDADVAQRKIEAMKQIMISIQDASNALKNLEDMYSKGKISKSKLDSAKKLYDSDAIIKGSAESLQNIDEAKRITEQNAKYKELSDTVKNYNDIVKKKITGVVTEEELQKLDEYKNKITELSDALANDSRLYDKDRQKGILATMVEKDAEYVDMQKQQYEELKNAYKEYETLVKKVAQNKALDYEANKLATLLGNITAIRDSLRGSSLYSESMEKEALAGLDALQSQQNELAKIAEIKKYYADLTATVKEYAAMRKRIAQGKALDTDTPEALSGLRSQIDNRRRGYNAETGALGDEGYDSELDKKALEGMKNLEAEIRQLEQTQLDKFWKNATKAAQAYYTAAKKVKDLQDAIDTGEKRPNQTQMEKAKQDMQTRKNAVQGYIRQAGGAFGNQEEFKTAYTEAENIYKTYGDVSGEKVSYEYENADKVYKNLIANAEKYYKIINKQKSGTPLTYKELKYVEGLKEGYEKLNAERTKFDEHLSEGNKGLSAEYDNVIRQINQTQATKDFDKINEMLSSLENTTNSTKFLRASLEDIRKKYDEIDERINNIDWNGASEEEIKELQDDISGVLNTLNNVKKNPMSKAVDFKDVTTLARQTQEWMSNNTNAKEANEQLSGLLETLKHVDSEGDLNNVRAAIEKVKQGAYEAGEAGKSFADKLTTSFQSLSRYLLSFASFYRIVGIFRQAVNTVKELDSALKETKMVTSESAKELRDWQMSTFDAADKVGGTAIEIQKSVASWIRLGKTFEEANEAAMASVKLVNVSEFTNIEDATSALLSIKQAFEDISYDNALDMLNSVGDQFSSTTQALSDGMKNVSQVLQVSGNDFAQSLALLAAGNNSVQSMEKAAMGVRTIALRIAGTEEAKKQLEDMGESTDDFVVQTSSKVDAQVRNLTKTASNPNGISVLDDSGRLRSTYDIKNNVSTYEKSMC